MCTLYFKLNLKTLYCLLIKINFKMKKLLNLSLLFAFIIFIGCEKKEKKADTKKDAALTLNLVKKPCKSSSRFFIIKYLKCVYHNCVPNRIFPLKRCFPEVVLCNI